LRTARLSGFQLQEETIMASAQMPDEFMEELEAHLPPEQPVRPKGGRPPVAHTVVMRAIWFVLCSG
jgi:hypothetical protein